MNLVHCQLINRIFSFFPFTFITLQKGHSAYSAPHCNVPLKVVTATLVHLSPYRGGNHTGIPVIEGTPVYSQALKFN